jgi:protein SCO1/2
VSPSAPPSHRSFVWLILIAALAAALGLWFGNRQFGSQRSPRFESAVLYPQPRNVPDFELTRADGKPLTLSDWHGRWTVVYFGYASCPDVCPTRSLRSSRCGRNSASGLHEARRHRLHFCRSASAAPERLGPYVAFFSPDFVAATGSDEQLTGLTRSLGLLYSRSTGADGTIQVDHSGSAVIIDPQGRLVGIFRPPFAPAALARDLAVLAAANAG